MSATAFPLDETARFIMGRPVFVLAPIAWRLRELGHQIATKCEDEQAYAIHWLLHLYFEQGEKWRDEMERQLRA